MIKSLQVDDRRPGVEAPDAVLRAAFDLDALRRVERGDGLLGLLDGDPVQPHLPDGGGEPVGETRGAGLDRVGDVETVRKRVVEQLAQRARITGLGEGDLQELGLAARAGGCGVGVRDLGVRGEARRVGHGHLGAAQRPLEGTLEVSVTGEPEAAALGVAQSDALHCRCGRRAFGLSLAQWFFSSVRSGRGGTPPSKYGWPRGVRSGSPLLNGFLFPQGDLWFGRRAGHSRCTTQSTRRQASRFPGLGFARPADQGPPCVAPGLPDGLACRAQRLPGRPAHRAGGASGGSQHGVPQEVSDRGAHRAVGPAHRRPDQVPRQPGQCPPHGPRDESGNPPGHPERGGDLPADRGQDPPVRPDHRPTRSTMTSRWTATPSPRNPAPTPRTSRSSSQAMPWPSGVSSCRYAHADGSTIRCSTSQAAADPAGFRT